MSSPSSMVKSKSKRRLRKRSSAKSVRSKSILLDRSLLNDLVEIGIRLLKTSL
jgi:hypothetical protein